MGTGTESVAGVAAIDPWIRSMVRDDSLTRGLGDVEARMLVDQLPDPGNEIRLTQLRSRDIDGDRVRQNALRQPGVAFGRHLLKHAPADGGGKLAVFESHLKE